jgi:integral membrane protein 2B
MTIITQPITEKKLAKQKVPLVIDGNGVEQVFDGKKKSTVAVGLVTHTIHNDLEAGNRDGRRRVPNALMVTVMRNRAHRVSSLTTICVFLTALLVFATGILGGVYLYRQFNQYKMRHFRGWCTIPYAEQAESEQLQALQTQESTSLDKAIRDLFQSMSHTQDKSRDFMAQDDRPSPPFNTFFDEEFDIDIEYEEYERIEVPDFSHGRRGRFIHDFSVNKTGIIDLEAERCFLLPLNRSTVLPPHSLYDLVSKMRTGYYDVDTEVVRESYRVITPPISDVKMLGYYIGRECANLPSYELERVQSPVFKRSTNNAEGKTIFAEFAGVKISEFHIVNLHSAPGNKK